MKITRLLFLLLCFFISYSEALKVDIGAVEISVPYFVALAGLASLAIESGLLGRKPRIRVYRPAAAFCIIYTILGLIALLHVLLNRSANSPDAMFRVLEQIGRLFLSFSILVFASNAATDAGLALRGARTIVLSAGLVGLYGIYQVVATFGRFYRPLLPHTGSYGLAPGDQGATRAIGTMQEPSFLAGFLCFSIILTMTILASGKGSRAQRLILWVSLIIQGFSLALTSSSGGFAGFVVALIAGCFIFRGRIRRRLIFIWITLAFMLSWPILYYAAVSRFGVQLATATVGKATHASAEERRGMAMGALRMVADHPVLGVGPGMYDDHVRRYTAQFRIDRVLIPNNVYAELLAETGLVGFAAFMIMFIGLCRRAASRWRSASGDKALAAGLCMSLISLSVQFIAYPTFKMEFIWLLFGLILAPAKEAEPEPAGE